MSRGSLELIPDYRRLNRAIVLYVEVFVVASASGFVIRNIWLLYLTIMLSYGVASRLFPHLKGTVRYRRVLLEGSRLTAWQRDRVSIVDLNHVASIAVEERGIAGTHVNLFDKSGELLMGVPVGTDQGKSMLRAILIAAPEAKQENSVGTWLEASPLAFARGKR